MIITDIINDYYCIVLSANIHLSIIENNYNSYYYHKNGYNL